MLSIENNVLKFFLLRKYNKLQHTTQIAIVPWVRVSSSQPSNARHARNCSIRGPLEIQRWIAWQTEVIIIPCIRISQFRYISTFHTRNWVMRTPPHARISPTTRWTEIVISPGIPAGSLVYLYTMVIPQSAIRAPTKILWPTRVWKETMVR